MDKRTYERAFWDLYRAAPPGPTYARLPALERVAPRSRDKAIRLIQNWVGLVRSTESYRPRSVRLQVWKKRQAEALAARVGYKTDEHGWHARGDHFQVTGLDYVPAREARGRPYLDLGGEGLGLVRVVRHRVYANSSRWYPRDVSSVFLVGRNEAGTYFGHPVPATITSVDEALDWIWGGKAKSILARQGDIAVVTGLGPKIPSLPEHHRIEGSFIIHPSHAPLPLPSTGQRIIVGRRAVAFASSATRD